MSAIYSRTDGIVNWRGCVEAEGERLENIEVRGTHAGLCHNPAVLLAIADRLAQDPAHWRPFQPTPTQALLYPHRRPASWERVKARARREGGGHADI